MNTKYDVAIVGGGIVGLLTSLALARTGCSIIHIEKDELEVKNDNRSIAVSYSSIAFLNTLGLWDKVASKTQTIKKVHVSDKGRYGRAEIFAKDENLPFLGAIAPMRELLAVALQNVAENENIEKAFKTNVVSLQKNADDYSLVVEQEQQDKIIQASLIIACDGASSSIRKMLNLGAQTTDYKQDAVVFDIQTDLDNDNTAFERFMTDGVLAMLPKSKTTMGCVWTVDREDSKAKLNLGKKEFEELVQDRFGYRLGQIEVATKPAVFPLYLVQSNEVYKDNVLFFGNALHFLHPVSGQGMNLSIRDIGFLYDLLVESDFSQSSIAVVLEEFAKVRKPDHDRTINITHGFVKWFVSNDFKFVASRNVGLHLLQRSRLAKKVLSRVMMGKLTRGSTLMRKVVEDEH
ncbi:FAD-dependent monooxygenase [Francisella philomiragia]|uniref:2-octaprenyl-6-methoxyphenyl hydroxylase n=1 Tax=Francisella philomiragia subsp. philomiragia (strain ATCC 25017 / CCUG 19701 / FSC 153 / O\|nr:FAD-dependent monooxygenase [Francisella philomiragia]AJI46550.1 ubiquinone biosynthesis hydroxylase, UbiH/UbiF/VisC/COQ6 family protein [Francisella philomiragia]AJI49974.1 ubiquinone biosynthesis hydroxylase, UbiH/UbiF/VisC/COQ6 family protein [Francisella philomiragia]MBK2019890.1 FAD-dependent monooxygenase [Francisella philomiragia]MBK2029659.1 FAD-dependent monooxygenase [Francisella philomiragia]MBK2264098.1 FAD-dependent monooxygenase [Francisella philomiragia]